MNDINWSPENYKQVNFIAKEAELEMVDRLQWMTIKPRRVLDLGCGLGGGAIALQNYFPQAEVYALDQSIAMLKVSTISPDIMQIAAEAEQLPFPTHSIDLIFANALIPWCSSPQHVLRECRRVLRADGLLMFSALGPDSFKELTSHTETPTAWLPQLYDLHDIGDILLHERFADPVVDVSYMTAHYSDTDRLHHDLIHNGIINPSQASQLTPHQADGDEASFPITLEIVYAHAFAPANTTANVDQSGITNISLDDFKSMVNIHS